MNQLCKVCGEPAAGFHFGAFTCEGCKSFFGRTYNNLSQIHECKNGGTCVINKQNRTSCKACRLKKCLCVGMSKSGSRYGRRSNWFKIHCLLQEQALQLNRGVDGGGTERSPLSRSSPPPMSLLSPGKSEDENKGETLTESISSDHSIESDRKGSSTPVINPECTFPKGDQKLNGEPITGSDFVANFGLYTFHPSLSFLHASQQFYSRLYPHSLYPGAAPPHLMIPPPFSPNRSPTDILRLNPSHSPPITTSSPNSTKHSNPHSPYSGGSPDTSPHHPPPSSPPLSLLSIAANPIMSPFIQRKRGAESPLAEPPYREPSPSVEQAAPIDLRVKRRRLSTHSTASTKVSNTPPPSPPLSIIQTSGMGASLTPIDLTTKA